MGIEFRRLGEEFTAERSCVRSRIAPAVLGLESVGSRVEVRDRGTPSTRAGLLRPLGDAADTIEEMLPDRECPGRTVTVLEVSLETRDKGLGMNSRVSENPTRALLLGLFCFGLLSGEDRSMGFGECSGSSGFDSGSGAVGGRGSRHEAITEAPDCPNVVGLVGALLPRPRELSKTGA